MADAYTQFFSTYKAEPAFNKEHETGVLESYLQGNLSRTQTHDEGGGEVPVRKT